MGFRWLVRLTWNWFLWTGFLKKLITPISYTISRIKFRQSPAEPEKPGVLSNKLKNLRSSRSVRFE